MKCQEFRDRLDDLSGSGITDGMREHLSGCGDCRKYYSEIGRLTPKAFPPTPENIAANVLKRIGRKERLNSFFTMRTGISKIAASVAAAIVIAVGVILIGGPTPARSAERLIDKCLAAASSVKTMNMAFDVRTAQKENFAYIDLDKPMVGHTLTVLRGNPAKWRLDKKKGRSIVFDGVSKYMWTPDYAMSVKGDGNSRFEEWFATLLDPEMILLKEKLAAQDGDTQYSVRETDSGIVMTACVPAKGNFTNPYLLNTSIPESDTRREIVFDKQTDLIKSLKIYVLDKGKEILVVDVKNVMYDMPVDEKQLTDLPDGIDWIVPDAAASIHGLFADITPEEAAGMIFAAAENRDLNSVRGAFAYYEGELFRRIEKQYNGLKIIGLGKSFGSGVYPGVFIPYEVKMPNGMIKKHNMALRNDNPNREWLVDGGI